MKGRRKASDSGAPQARREELDGSTPVHVTPRMLEERPRLRARRTSLGPLECFEAARREDFRVVHFGVQEDHVHLLVVVGSAEALGRGMTGLSTRLPVSRPHAPHPHARPPRDLGGHR